MTMRKWFRYRLNPIGNQAKQASDNNFFGDLALGLDQEKDIPNSFNKDDFFKNYFYNYADRVSAADKNVKRYSRINKKTINRLREYDRILRQYLQKDKMILSIGSGRCINELLFIDQGYDLVCSDIEMPDWELAKRIFPDLRFIKLDIRSAVQAQMHQGYDFIIALGVFFLFDNEELLTAFRNVAQMLKKGGRLIFDFGGARENFPTLIIDEILCKYETKARFFIKQLKNRKCVFTRMNPGYRRTDNEIISLAGEAELKFLSLITSDYDTEITRSILLSRLANRGGIFRKIVRKLAESIPYVRMFSFELS